MRAIKHCFGEKAKASVGSMNFTALDQLEDLKSIHTLLSFMGPYMVQSDSNVFSNRRMHDLLDV